MEPGRLSEAVRLERFGGARELFDAVRDASYELWRHDAEYNALERRALSLGSGIASRGTSGLERDRLRPVDAMVDFEAMMARRVDEWCALVDYGEAVLYGSDWEHGIAKSLGIGYAEVLELTYVQRLSLRETSKRMHVSHSTCKRMRSRALSFIDAVGCNAAIAGE